MNYNYTHIIGDYLAINQNEKTWSPFPYKKVYNYSDLIDYEIIENGKTIYSSISSKGAGGIGKSHYWRFIIWRCRCSCWGNYG